MSSLRSARIMDYIVSTTFVPFPFSLLNFQLAACQFGAFAHTDQPKVTCGCVRFHVKAHAVILNGERGDVTVAFQAAR